MQFPTRYKHLAACAAQEKGRYAMHHLRLEGDKLIATDGRRLVVVPVTLDEHDVDGFVTQEALVAACKAKSPRKGDAVLLANGDLRAPFGNYVAPRPDPKEGEFPRWKAVVPDIKPGDPGTVTIAFNPEYLLEIAKCLTTADAQAAILTFKVGKTIKGKPITDEERAADPTLGTRTYHYDTKDMTRTDGGPILVRGSNVGGFDGYGVLMPITVE